MTAFDEVLALEEALRQAELGPDPSFFERYLADDAVLDGRKLKAKVVAAHQPGGPAKFTAVEMSDFELTEHAPVVVVTCNGDYHTPTTTHRLRFTRVWLKGAAGWQIVAGSTAPRE